MIGSLRGKLIENTGDRLLVDVGGVGYLVYVAGDTAASLFDQTGQTVFLYTYHVVREDTLDLYGFMTPDEKRLFEMVISVSGIGPKSGLGIVSIAPLPQLVSAIAAGDTSYLTQVSGVGKKSAQKIVLELQDKLSDGTEFATTADNSHSADSEVLAALVSLGYTQTEARAAIKSIDAEVTGMQPRLTAALRSMTG